MSVHWLGKDDDARTPEDAVGYMAANADRASGVVVITKAPDGLFEVEGFGDIDAGDVAAMSTLLGYRVARFLWGDDEDEG